MLGSLLGLSLTDTGSTGTAAEAAARATTSAERRATGKESQRASQGVPRGRRGLPQIAHRSAPEKAHERRAVRVIDWDVAAEATEDYPLVFYREGPDVHTIIAELRLGRTGTATLFVETSARTLTGVYKAAICDAAGLQLGHIEIGV
jgi:hypothetical protein